MGVVLQKDFDATVQFFVNELIELALRAMDEEDEDDRPTDNAGILRWVEAKLDHVSVDQLVRTRLVKQLSPTRTEEQ